MMRVKQINQWTNPVGHVQRTNPKGNVQRTNPMGNVYKGPILWGQEACYKEPDASTEDQSYGTVHVATCTYARFQVRALCRV